MENPTTNPQLTITDLVSMRQIIEATCQRGVWQATEIRGVGELYERLTAFLESVAPPQATEQPTPQGDKDD